MLSEKYRQALDFAATLHHGHMRKGTEIDYLLHLLSVSSLVMEHGGREDRASPTSCTMRSRTAATTT